ncbi:MAG: M48 family metalloprotease [Armatimonadetes bacterium]|nr:M48 family metalloprotease [Armatimonadota bacterium]
MSRKAALSAIAFVLLLAAGCKDGHLLSREDEIKLGRQAGDDFERKYGLDPDQSVRALVKNIGARISRAATPPDYPYDYRALNCQEVNANAFPGGRIYVWRGLIDLLQRDEDQLAWVVAHETAHVARRHVTRRLERAIGYEALIAFIFRQENAARIAGVIADLVLRDYGRDQEYEADRWGLKYAHDAGYDPTAAVAVLQKFQQLQGREPSNVEILFETHPGNNARINAVKAYIREQGWRGSYYTP